MKVLVSDFDGTFFNKDYEKNIELVNNFVDQGNMFVIATGRNITDLRRDMDSHFIKCSYFICNDGATIFDQFMNVIYRKDLDPKLVRTMYNALSSVSYISNVYLDISTSFVTDINRPANKVVGQIIDREKCVKLANKINDYYPELFAYVSRNWINITNRKLTKGSAIKFLEQYYNFDEYEIYTFGDGINDISLGDYKNSYVLNSSFVTTKKNFNNVVNSFEEVINKITERNDKYE